MHSVRTEGCQIKTDATCVTGQRLAQWLLRAMRPRHYTAKRSSDAAVIGT
jgi:hypothetical protein